MSSFKILAYQAKQPKTHCAGFTVRAVLGALVLCAGFVGPAVAKKRHAHERHTQGSSATESLNEQQLQSLAAASPTGACSQTVGAPQPLSVYVQQDGASGCAGALGQPIPPPGWVLTAGGLVGQQIVSWGQRAGWNVLWRDGQDWVVPSSVEFHGDFSAAASQVLEDLSAEGASVHGVFYQGNHTLVITGDNQ